MNTAESKAEVYMMALYSLTKIEREAVINRLLDDTELREDILDLAIIRMCEGEPTRPFKEYLAHRKEKVLKS